MLSPINNSVDYLPKLKEFEGVFSHMYQDTAGNITVGVGYLLASVATAQRLGFVLRPDPQAGHPVLARPATAEEIKADFDSISSQTPGKLAAYYKRFTKLDLPESVIDSLLQSTIQQFYTVLCVAFPNLNSYPAEACTAIFDMGYNLGVGKLKSQFPKFCKAVNNMDWSTAAQQCHRNGISEMRNQWTRAQLESAATHAQSASHSELVIRP